jgi:hypothetical protein
LSSTFGATLGGSTTGDLAFDDSEPDIVKMREGVSSRYRDHWMKVFDHGDFERLYKLTIWTRFQPISSFKPDVCMNYIALGDQQ